MIKKFSYPIVMNAYKQFLTDAFYLFCSSTSRLRMIKASMMLSVRFTEMNDTFYTHSQ